MDRRSFLAAAGAVTALTGTRQAQAAAASPAVAAGPVPRDGRWRMFEVVTDLELRPDAGTSRVWLPLPLTQDTPFQRTLGVEWTGSSQQAGIRRDETYGAPAFCVEWQDGSVLQEASVKATVMTRNRFADLSRPGVRLAVTADDQALYLRPTSHIPTDGIVRDTARRITALAPSDNVSKARAIYEWIVENTFRDPKTAGCGVGDVVAMLESGRLGGKCADLSALFVGLARASGVPARDVYGVRVANSANWKSLGRAGDITKAQHCRAEFYDARHGWVPVDPADVRKVVLEEDPAHELALDDPRVVAARKALFGAWEMNWIAYNTAGDTFLAPRTTKPLGHFMYPHAETARGVLDPYDPDAFRYRITSRELTA